MKKKNRSRRLQNMNTNMPDRWPMNMIHMNTNTPDDRLSALPDDVISHILSFLPTTKTSIQTSVLAKGWRRLWTRVTSLDFTIENPADWKIVDEVIMLRHKGQIIHTFRLHSCYDSELIEPWIETVVERKVQTLFIHLVNDQFIWPSCLSASQTLVDLSLLNCSGTIPTTINFPALKKLLLKLNEFECKNPDESLPRLLSGCPVLEDLEIQMLFCSKNIELCSPTLTRLSVGYDHQWDVCWLLKLDTPALRHLHLRSDHDSEVFSAGTLTSVTHAQVDCCVHNCVESDIHDDVERSKLTSCSRNFLEFVGKLYNVERLKLRCPLIVPYPTFSAFLAPKFRNLTELNLSVGLCFLKCFLENADNLRLLTISDSDTGHWTEPEYWEEPEQVPSCLISSLETVNLVDFALVNSREFDVARYILKNGKVLKRMAISTRANRFYHHPDSINYKEEFKAAKKGKFKALKRLALFERGSNACQLAFELVDLTLTTLTEADVLISVYTIAWIYSDRDDDGEIDIERKVAYSRSVGKLCNVKCLKLTSPLIVPHSTFSPKFHNSTQLNLCDYICYGFLKSFLKLMRALIAFDSL